MTPPDADRPTDVCRPTDADLPAGARPGDGQRPARGYRLIGADGLPYRSATPGRYGGHRRQRVYGRLDCPSALRAIAAGGYVAHRVFFADEPTAVAAGYRPCAVCLPARYAAWRADAGRSARPADAAPPVGPAGVVSRAAAGRGRS